MKQLWCILGGVCLLAAAANADLQTLTMENTDGAFTTVVQDTVRGTIWWQDLTTFAKDYPGGDAYAGQLADIALLSPIVGYRDWHLASAGEFEALVDAATVATDPYLDLSRFQQFVPTKTTSSDQYWEGVIEELYFPGFHVTQTVEWWVYAGVEGAPDMEWDVVEGYMNDTDAPWPSPGAWVCAQPVPVPGAVILGVLGLGSSGWLIRRKRHDDRGPNAD